MVLKLLSARPLLGWLELTRLPKASRQKNNKAVVLSGHYNRGRSQQHAKPVQSLSGPLYDEDRITSLTYENTLYKRLPNESMAEFHQRVIRGR